MKAYYDYKEQLRIMDELEVNSKKIIETLDEKQENIDILEGELNKAIGALKKCSEQMNYYSCEIRDNPSSWNEVINNTNEVLKDLLNE